MRHLLVSTILFFPLLVWADQLAQGQNIRSYQSSAIKPSSNLNIPTPTFQVRNYRFDGFYIGMNAGVANPGEDRFRNEFNTGYDLNPQVGYQIGQGRIELSPIFTYNSAGKKTITTMKTYSIMLNGYYDFPYSAVPLSPRLTPYLGIGGGRMSESGARNAQTGPNGVEWTYQFIIGMMYRVTLNWYVQADYHLQGWPEHDGHFNLFNLGFTYHFT